MAVKLYAPAEYWTTPASIRRKICNGCGPSGWKGLYVPDHLLWLSIRQACDIHDWMYWAGQTEADREQADRVFLNNMLRLVEAGSANFATRFARRRLALHYYSVVRDYGAQYFWSADKNPAETFREPLEAFA